ncbi:hypothetical protein MTO96_050140 [Rhipicephalus appendiculatus]
MLLGMTHDDDVDLLHGIRAFVRVEHERRELFGTRNRGLASSPDLEHSLSMTKEVTIGSNQGMDRRKGLPPIKQHGKRMYYNGNVYGHVARDCPKPEGPVKCQSFQATDHTQRNCKAFSRNESNVVVEKLPRTDAGDVFRKEVIFNDDFALVGLIDTGNSGCLLRASAAVKCGIEMVQEPTLLYGFGKKNVPVKRSLGHFKAKISIYGVADEKIPVLALLDDAQNVDLLVGRSFTDLPFVTYAKVRNTFPLRPHK